ncbi:MAG TPA: 4-coumarate--CoA ligase family protein [Thermoanaerobaculia bacterium]|jgi:acyl-CoA synthetase (AMP-forming)/AMP-acid ligase II|nr:4-coumarate--CoA ligase family protein [Thermoanaerobaculia bacterium]
MIFRAPEQPLTIPEIPLTPFLLDRAAGRGDKPAFIDGSSGRTLTYAGWAQAVRETAAGLARRGLRKGGVFAIYSPNAPEYAVFFHAVSLLGGVVTTINPLYTAGELAAQLRDSGARYLITAPSCADKAGEAARDAGVTELLVFGDSVAFNGEPPEVDVDPRHDLVVLPYSSGTTGLPKGVMLTHYNLVANILQSACAIDIGERDTMLGVLPFFHIYGMVVIMNLGLYVGATVVTMPRFDLEQCLATIEKYRVTFANVVPPIVLALAKSPLVDKYDLSSLRTLFSGAAPLGTGVAAAVSARLGCQVLQGYGLTETSPVTHTARTSGSGPKTAGIGPPVPNTEAKIIDTITGAELGSDQEGEVCVRGPQVMKGYLNRPEATAAMIDPDGWLHTGDVGYADADGNFFIVDRVKELIKYKGLQIAPAELEAVLLGHPSVADAAVVPLADEEAGQVPKAFVVLKGEATPDEIMRYVAEHVAPYKKIRSLQIIDQIPRSPSGKILRRVLVARGAV